MKTRNGFVSNSSSCSFVIEVNAAEAVKIFLEDFGEFLTDTCSYNALGESLKVGVKCKDNDDGWFDWTEPSSFAADYTVGRWKDDDSGRDAPKKTDDVCALSFDCDDYDKASMMWLLFLRRYFTKLGFKPDDSQSEIAIEETSMSFLDKVIDRIESQCCKAK